MIEMYKKSCPVLIYDMSVTHFWLGQFRERTAELIIRQSLLSVHITMVTGESKSKSLSASIGEILGEVQLTYCYLNTPKSEYRNRSEIHYGTAMLSISNPKEIDVQYYTDQRTIWDMCFILEWYYV